ncbi:hypothetical protein SEA_REDWATTLEHOG_156 [Gordonia phage RedWattleHog]|uniref:Uncharacterized protein n=1 Tax=Gordonia phage Stormageddon TaxID=2656541 RepID=A0A649VR83_9CAUD|nr:hypothetical protein KHQ86_gp143 [Gordonia phage Stormageddon]QGJ95017.1 hypothetical protein SEA_STORMAGEDDON_157 [Gordonia phage Stormageddon]QLF83659.1 hypothetical protein SEA_REDWATTLEHOG_156 [Gordonia phage RedWattleHog]
MSENLTQQLRDLKEGDTVVYQGRDHKVFRVKGKWIGLIDPERERMFSTNEKGVVQGPVAHFAVPLTEVDLTS